MGTMPYLQQSLLIAVVVTITLMVVVVLKPDSTSRRGGQVLGFVAFFVLPLALTSFGVAAHLEHSKSTEFCLSCHVMEPYGESLMIDAEEYVPAAHFQNSLIPRDQVCFTCHTTYTMYGDLRAKLQGLQHVYVYYLGTVPEKIELYQPYNNRECLNCHNDGRRFEENELHIEVRAELASNETSCLECHDAIHDVTALNNLPKWTQGHHE